MGRFKGKGHDRSDITLWLVSNGFFYRNGTSPSTTGYRKAFAMPGEPCHVWITVNLDDMIIYVFKEYDGGGKKAGCTIAVKEEWMQNRDVFINAVDERLIEWIG